MTRTRSMDARDDEGGALTGAPLSRRELLRAAGVGGIGLAGLGAATSLAPAAYAAGISAIALGQKIAPHKSNWDLQCSAGQFWAEVEARGVSQSAVTPYDPAFAGFRASTIVGHDPATTPAGTFTWYGTSAPGHVVTNIGNGYCINTSTHPAKTYHDFGNGLRITKIADYTYLPYQGWSNTFGVNPKLSITPWTPDDDPDWAWNPPSASVQKAIQTDLAKRGRYDGPADGKWGVESIKGIQTTCQNVGYTGPVDGVPGERTCHYVQVYAQKFGDYQGPVDSVLGPNSWDGFALGLHRP